MAISDQHDRKAQATESSPAPDVDDPAVPNVKSGEEVIAIGGLG